MLSTSCISSPASVWPRTADRGGRDQRPGRGAQAAGCACARVRLPAGRDRVRPSESSARSGTERARTATLGRMYSAARRNELRRSLRGLEAGRISARFCARTPEQVEAANLAPAVVE